ncbi:MAG: hypothetical protein WCL04_10205 [Verrucomicrobiota bacterium]
MKLGTHWHLKLDGSNKYDPGVIIGELESNRWRYETQPKRLQFFELIKKPDFVVIDSTENECLRIRRHSRLLPSFEMIEDGQVIGKITLCSVLRNKYTFELRSGPTWTFRMPLFTVHFPGESSEGKQIWIIVGPSKKQWNVLIQPGADSLQLLAFLAFVHREWWKFG